MTTQQQDHLTCLRDRYNGLLERIEKWEKKREVAVREERYGAVKRFDIKIEAARTEMLEVDGERTRVYLDKGNGT